MATNDQSQAGKKPAKKIKTKKEKREDIVLTKDNLLYQPLALAVNGYEATAFQQNVVIAVLRNGLVVCGCNADVWFARVAF